MKKFRYIIMLLAVIGFTACDSDSIEGLQGTFSDITFCDFNNANVLPTTKLGKGVKSLNTQFTDADGNTLSLSFGSKEWILGEGSFTPVATVETAGTYAGTVNGSAISEGNVDVSIVEETYFITGLVKTADGKQYKTYYKGPLTFIVGEDDPEASGYTMSIQTSAVAIMDWTTWQTTTYPDVTKYTITVCDPNGAQVAMFDVINDNDKTADQLTGSYTIVSDAHDAMQISAGYSLPDYGMAGGSSFVDAAGATQYLTGGGTVEITTATGIDGSTLYSFKGTGLGTTDITGATGSGSFNIMFVSFLDVKGTIYRDIEINSAKMGATMKYSIYLPEGWDGQTTLPVIYLLHGAGDDQNSWLDKGNMAALTSAAIQNGELGKVAVVTPDAQLTFYCNDYENYFFEELVPTVENTFNLGKDKSMRAVGGLSMGGYGTLYYAVKHPEMFCCAYAMSPACYIDGLPNLFELYPAAAGTEIPDLTIEVGTEDATVYEMCPWMAQYIAGSGFTNFEYIERAGVHDWKFWKECYPKFLTKLGTYFK